METQDGSSDKHERRSPRTPSATTATSDRWRPTTGASAQNGVLTWRSTAGALPQSAGSILGRGRASARQKCRLSRQATTVWSHARRDSRPLLASLSPGLRHPPPRRSRLSAREIDEELSTVLDGRWTKHSGAAGGRWLRRWPAPNAPPVMTDASASAMELLTSKDLMDRIASDMEALGYVGEDVNKRLGYLVACHASCRSRCPRS